MTSRLGITSLSAGRMGVTTALGTQEIPLIQMTGAFATFGNNGARVPQRSILRIETADGTVLYKAPAQQKADQVLSPQADYMLTSVLSDNEARAADFGWENPLYFPDFPVAAKTGTSQGIIGPKDIITMGYSPWLSLGVWMGNTDNSDMQHIAGITGAGFIFGDVMQYAHDTYKWPKVAGFPIPPEMSRAAFNCVTGLAPYKDQPDTDCTFNPVTAGATNLWGGYNFGHGVAHKLNEDWYIQGQEPQQS
jgi:membrane peptidoglycan carboxypeptidase